MEIKLAEALLRRKELQQHVDRLKAINIQNLFEVKVQRKQVTDTIDDIVASVPKISVQQAEHTYNWYAKQLRLVDAAIQQANWMTVIELENECMADYIDPYIQVK